MKEIGFEGAVAIAMAKLEELCVGVPLQLLQDEVLEKANGWVFFYQSSDYLQTGQFNLQLVGNAPIYVRRDGYLSLLPTHSPLEQSILAADKAYTPLQGL